MYLGVLGRIHIEGVDGQQPPAWPASQPAPFLLLTGLTACNTLYWWYCAPYEPTSCRGVSPVCFPPGWDGGLRSDSGHDAPPPTDRYIRACRCIAILSGNNLSIDAPCAPALGTLPSPSILHPSLPPSIHPSIHPSIPLAAAPSPGGSRMQPSGAPRELRAAVRLRMPQLSLSRARPGPRAHAVHPHERRQRMNGYVQTE